MASLLYGAGLRLFEGQRLRVKDGNFEGGTVLIRAGKGDKDRVSVLPQTLYRPLFEHLEATRTDWETMQKQHSSQIPTCRLDCQGAIARAPNQA